MKDNTSKPNKLLNNKQFIIGLALVLATGIVAGGILTARAATEDSIYIQTDNTNTYIAGAGDDLTVERWKYLIRDDDTCNGSIFTDGGRNQDNHPLSFDSDDNAVYVVYNSNEYTPDNDDAITAHNGKYICFNAKLTDGSWQQVGRQLNLSTAAVQDNTLPSEEYEREGDCLNDQVWKAGQCVSPCETDYVLVAGVCVIDDGTDYDIEEEDIEEEGPCDEGVSSAECQAEHAATMDWLEDAAQKRLYLWEFHGCDDSELLSIHGLCHETEPISEQGE